MKAGGAATSKPAEADSLDGVIGLILAGGRGSRMAETRPDTPKPLVEIGGMPILEIVIRQLVRFGISEIHVALHHHADRIRRRLARCGPPVGARLTFIVEETPLGTIGAAGHLRDAGRTVLATNGDNLSGIHLGRMRAAHRDRAADMTVATHTERHRLILGEIVTDPGGRILDYLEKPVKEYRICSATSLIEPSMLTCCRRGVYLRLPDLVRRGIKDGRRVVEHHHESPWIDVNDENDLAEAQRMFRADPEAFFIPRDLVRAGAGAGGGG